MDFRYLARKRPCYCVSVRVMLPLTTLSMSGSPIELSFVKNYLKKNAMTWSLDVVSYFKPSVSAQN